MKIFGEKLRVVNLGLKSFADSMKQQGAEVVCMDWKPPAGGDLKLIEVLDKLHRQEIEKANKNAVERMLNSQPILVDIKQAKEVIPEMKKGCLILHAGPPIEWDKMCGPVKGAIIGALLYEGIAKTEKSAEKIAESGKIKFAPCHHHRAVGPMAGIISPSMYVFVVKNETFGNFGYATMNEGLGKVLRFGAYSPDVIKRLKWMEKILAPVLKKAVKISKGVNIKNIIAQALMMGDECHNRNVAATNLLLKEMTPHLLKTNFSKKVISDVVKFISGNPHFFLNLSMTSCKVTADTIKGLKNSTIVSAMARNGTEIGIRVAGLGDKWFTAPAGIVKGLYFAGFKEEDGNPDLGDSTITETAGTGGFAMAGAPAIVKFIGGTPQDAVKYTREMYEISFGKHRDFQMPNLNFSGTPLGMDIRKIVETGITPIINTGIAHKNAGIGQIGAGILRAPIEIFHNALIEFSERK